MPIVYKKGADGSLRFWSVEPTPYGIEIQHGHVGGEVQIQEEIIDEGKASRDLDEQIESRLQSRLNKKLDAGYVFDIEVAKLGNVVNRLGLVKPMLAKKNEDVDMSLFDSKVMYHQPKLDGNRCLVHNNGIRLIAYTRNGKEFTTLDHILEGLNIPIGCTLDGELYEHGTPLQTIVSLVKRKQEATKRIKYHVYDCVMDAPYSRRLDELKKILPEGRYPSITLVPTIALSPYSGRNLGAILSDYRAAGYEGGIVRSDYSIVRGKLVATGYEDSKRSSSLIKLKEWLDEEFKVTNITSSVDGWAICECECKGKRFNVSAPGSIGYKRMVLRNKNEFIGKMLTVQFAYYTKDGLPFHPTAVAFRDYE